MGLKGLTHTTGGEPGHICSRRDRSTAQNRYVTHPGKQDTWFLRDQPTWNLHAQGRPLNSASKRLMSCCRSRLLKIGAVTQRSHYPTEAHAGSRTRHRGNKDKPQSDSQRKPKVAEHHRQGSSPARRERGSKQNDDDCIWAIRKRHLLHFPGACVKCRRYQF